MPSMVPVCCAVAVAADRRTDREMMVLRIDAVFCHGGVVNLWTAKVLGMAPSLFVDVVYGSISRFLCASTGEGMCGV